MRRQRSMSSQYMKKPSSNPSSCSSTGRFTRMHAPETQSGDAGVAVGVRIADELVAPAGPGQDAVEEERLREGRAQAREAAHREVEPAFLVDDARRHGGDVRVEVGGLRELSDGFLGDRRIGVQEQDERRLAAPPADVAGMAEAPVLAQAARSRAADPRSTRACRRWSRCPPRRPGSRRRADSCSTASRRCSRLLYETTTMSTACRPMRRDRTGSDLTDSTRHT